MENNKWKMTCMRALIHHTSFYTAHFHKNKQKITTNQLDKQLTCKRSPSFALHTYVFGGVLAGHGVGHDECGRHVLRKHHVILGLCVQLCRVRRARPMENKTNISYCHSHLHQHSTYKQQDKKGMIV